MNISIHGVEVIKLTHSENNGTHWIELELKSLAYGKGGYSLENITLHPKGNSPEGIKALLKQLHDATEDLSFIDDLEKTLNAISHEEQMEANDLTEPETND